MREGGDERNKRKRKDEASKDIFTTVARKRGACDVWYRALHLLWGHFSFSFEIHTELIGSLKLDNVWVFVQLIQRPTRKKNQL